MKRIVLSIAVMLTASICMLAQVPQGINYQAVVRNAQGELMMNHTVTFSFSITPAPNSNLLYAETQQATTNEFGLVNLVVGNGTPTYSTFDALSWDIPYALFTQLTVDGNTIDMGAQALQSVPYALNSAGAMTLSPDATINADQIAGGNATTNQVLQFNGTDWVPADLPTGNGGGGLDLPFAETDTYNQALFSVTNQNQNAIEGYSTNGTGLYGSSINGNGISALTFATGAAAVYGTNFGSGQGVQGYSETGIGVAGQTSSTEFPAISGFNSNGDGVKGQSTESGASGVVGVGSGSLSYGVEGIATGFNSVGVRGLGNDGAGVYGSSDDGTGVLGSGEIGVRGFSPFGTAVKAESQDGHGIYTESDTGIALETNGKVKIAGASQSPKQGKVLTSDANGNATWEGGVAFKMTGIMEGANQNIPTSTSSHVLYRTEEYDLSNNYNTSSQLFTAPVSGIYHFDAQVRTRFLTDDIDLHLSIMLQRNGVVSVIGSSVLWLDANGKYDLKVNADVKLQPGDLVYVYFSYNDSFTGDPIVSLYDDPFSNYTNELSWFNGRLEIKL